MGFHAFRGIQSLPTLLEGTKLFNFHIPALSRLVDLVIKAIGRVTQCGESGLGDSLKYYSHATVQRNIKE